MLVVEVNVVNDMLLRQIALVYEVDGICKLLAEDGLSGGLLYHLHQVEAVQHLPISGYQVRKVFPSAIIKRV